MVSAIVAAIATGASAGQAAGPSLIVFSADRAPSLSGEIYRVDPNGRVVDLSSSPFQDTNPALSPDGKRVAFLSDRSGVEGIYEVGIDGRGLVQVAPSLQVTCDYSPGSEECPGLAWQPHGDRLAIGWSGLGPGGVWIVRRGGTTVHLHAANNVDGWSPDGRLLATIREGRGPSPNRLLVVSPAGHTRWSVSKVGTFGATWAADGLLAVTTGSEVPGARHGVAVYDEAGHLRFRARLGTADVWPTWSPDGTRLGIVSGKTVEVRTATGRILLRRKVAQALGWNDLGWVGDDRLVVAVGSSIRMLSLRTGKLRPASKRYFGFTSPDNKRVIRTARSGSGFALQVLPTAGGPAKTYTQVPGCSQGGGWGPDVGQIAFVPNSRSLVYESACTDPYPGLYSVPASGGTPRLITQSPREPHSTPALSQDGTEVAYSTQCMGHFCGSAATIGVTSMDGAERALTTPAKCGGGDEQPTWSPDGTTILFARWGCDGQPELDTVPAGGGAARLLGISGVQPAWGPSRIAYVGTAAPSAVWTANPDGTDPVQVGNGIDPAWSPSGQLAYLTGTNFTTLVVGSTEASLPFTRVTSLAWSPDGARLVVAARAANTAALDVYTINPDGTDPVRLTENYDALSVTG